MPPTDAPSPVRYTRYNRLNPDGSGRFEVKAPVGPVKATRSQSMLEYFLFGLFAVLFALVGVAVYSSYSPKHRLVPNLVDAGMRTDRVNILFIGIGGDSHPGGGKDLADSMMLASLKPSTQQVAVVSIPRDLWVKVGRYGTHRLNSAHSIGNDSGYPGAGPGLLGDTVSGIFGQPVHAFVRIDFSAFEKVIDDLGGIDVYVQRSFYDYLFKDGFTKGWHHLDGKRALAFSRYRYVIGSDGDNFSREFRQQQVVNAVRDKLQHVGPQQALHLIQVLSTVSHNTETNLTAAQMLTLYRRYHDVDPKNVRHVSLKPLTELFMVTRFDEPGEAVRPRRGSYSEFQRMEANIFSSNREISTEDQIDLAAAPTPPRRQTQSMLSTFN